MEEKTVFISSCTRRQLSRRKPSPNAYRLQLLLATLLLCGALLVFAAVRLGA